MARWVEVLYKCRCMATEASLQVRERADGEDILVYMGRLQMMITADHSRRSPLCVAGKLEYAKIPVADGVVGGGAGGTA